MKTKLFDQKTFTKETAMIPFALTDILTETAGKHKKALLHFWQFEQSFILGMKDTRVNHLSKGVKTIKNNGYQPVIRNAGGLGVISDEGILNISWIFPKEQVSIDQSYQKMLDLIQKAFPELTIKAYEIQHSYCPGKFDLSVEGKKVAGIAQRRVKEGIAVMMYLSVFGDQQQRSEIVRAFYQESLGTDYGKNGYPDVWPSTMTTLSDALHQPLTIQETKKRFLQVLDIDETAQNALNWIKEKEQMAQFQKKMDSMQQRNKQLEELNHVSTL
ncbi:lipoate--protein ligase family protein [Tetragenococcus muriaticus]|uniref:Lipoate-protein ligase A n=2 Tax=Tetragenococcus muriaticus TaxID=64642 RepID=A0A091CCH1_9ENTE|nr:lipoate--protein ligase family protein [Tetragenococcus muriaticus]KFN90323.1 lipoate-protein ligase A [Tetragenococcus muriaticus 3MR10-3]GMA46755.1 lipoate--protein ligase A [Tetragenococcus muriaticus]